MALTKEIFALSFIHMGIGSWMSHLAGYTACLNREALVGLWRFGVENPGLLLANRKRTYCPGCGIVMVSSHNLIRPRLPVFFGSRWRFCQVNIHVLVATCTVLLAQS